MDTEPNPTENPKPPSPKKTILKETPNPNKNTSTSTNEQVKSDPLRDYFNCIANREVLHLNSKSVTPVLSMNLGIDLKTVSSRMKYVLAEALCYFMKVWPGWSINDYKNPLLKDECYAKYKDYLRAKLTYIIENESQFCKDTEFKRKEVTSTETQTDIPPKTNKPEAPFSLVICGQPSVLNNIVFVEVDNNIVIKQHLEKPWKQLAPMTFFINHPYVKINVDLPGVRFSRSNVHVYKRYITECGDTASCPQNNFVTEIVNNVANSYPKVYSYDFIAAYFKQLIAVLTKYEVKNRLLLQSVFHEFLQDIKDCNIKGGTMAEPYTVTFNIGGRVYVRNKKMVVSSSKNKDANAINFCEILTPKISFTLHEFNVEEDVDAPEISFKDLNKIDTLPKEERLALLCVFNNCVTFCCTLCNKVYYGERSYTDCMDHFRFLHKGEQAVLCFKCRKTYEVINLATTRWSHSCNVLIKAEDGNNGGGFSGGGNGRAFGEGTSEIMNVSAGSSGLANDRSKHLN